MLGRPQADPERLGKVWTLLLFGAALGLRLVYIGWAPQPPVLWDAEAYCQAGASLAAGQEKPQVRAFIGQRGPGYPLFLAAISLLGPNDPWPVRCVQAGLGALTCVVVASVGRQLAGRRVGLLAGFLTALYPPLILFTGRLLTETLAAFLLWLGLDLLVRGRRGGRLAWLVPAGLVLALACLTRPTLLPAAPFFVGAVLVAARPVRLRRRVLESAAFAVPLAGVLVGWNALSGVERPTVGAGGLHWVFDTAQEVLSPGSRGWATEGRPPPNEPPDPAYEEWLRGSPPPFGHPVTSAANLVFQHLWFPENAWRENTVLSPEALDGWHRALVLLGLGGFGLAVGRWRVFAPLLALAPAFVVVTVCEWIELRHNVPFMPAAFVLAALFAVSLAGWLKAAWNDPFRRVQWALGVGGAAALTVALFQTTRLSFLAGLFPSADAVTLGRAGDAAALGLALLWGAVVFRLARPLLGRVRAAVAGLLPAGLFVILFGSYAVAGSEPRWRAWGVDCGRLPGPVVQEITLPAPLPGEQIDSAEWLVDLETDADPPPLRVGVNGAWLVPAQYSWSRRYCPPDQSPYGTFSGFAGRPLPSWPQWWGLRVDPATLGQGGVLTLTLAGETGAPSRVCVGGTYSRGPNNAFEGPSTQLRFCRSLYRWLVVGDWRVWAKAPLGSLATHSSFARPHGPAGKRDPEAKVLSRLLDRECGQFNIRLLVKFKDGREVLY